MADHLYQSSVGVFRGGLGGLAVIREKAEAYADQRRMKHKIMLDAQLAPDMYPLYRQFQIACDFACQASARLAGIATPPSQKGEPDFAQLAKDLKAASDYLDNLTPLQFEGRDKILISFPVGERDMTLPANQYLLGFATQNFFFHYVTAYDILRHLGVPLGKRDYFGMTE